MKLNTGITEEHARAVADKLNVLLADEYVLYVKTLNYHWSVVGSRFNDLHAFFERNYKELFLVIDEVAERVRMIGEYPLGSMQEFLKHARLSEDIVSDHPVKDDIMIQRLLNDYEAIIRSLRVDVGETASVYHDLGTSNFLNDLLEKHEKTAWMLRSLITQ